MSDYPYTYADLGRMMGGRLECLGGNLYGYVAWVGGYELILTTDGFHYVLSVCRIADDDHDHAMDDAVFEYLYADEAAAMIREYVR